VVDFVSDEVVRIKCTDIVVLREERQRKIFTTDDLEASISQYGVLQPIVVWKNAEGAPQLVMGERRLTTCIALGLPDIPARFAKHKLNRAELDILEFEENVKRQDLSWPEFVEAVYSIHNRFLDTDPKWTQEQTASAVGVTHSSVSRMLVLAEAIQDGDEELLSAPSFSAAYTAFSNKLERRKEAATAAIEDIVIQGESFDRPPPGLGETPVREHPLEEPASPAPATPPPPPSAFTVHPDAPIINGDFLELAATYGGTPFNLLHCDFPYGIDIQDSDQANSLSHGTYDDSPDLYIALLRALADNLDRLVSSSAHIIFWHAWKFHVETRQFFAENCSDLWVQDVPLIWHKSDNRGIMSDATRRPRNTTEVALLISRGDRKFVPGKATGNSYAAPTSRVIHQSEKPVPVLKHFFSMLVDENTRMLDPTSGSANALIAADTLGAGQVLGIEKDEDYYTRSALAWKKYHKLKTLSEGDK